MKESCELSCRRLTREIARGAKSLAARNRNRSEKSQPRKSMREKIPRCVTTVGISRARSRVRVAAVCPWAPSDARTRALIGPSIERVVRETIAASAAAVATVPAARALAPARWETLDRPITTSADAERAEIDGDAPRFCIVRLARAARADPSSCPAAGAAAASEGGSPAGGSPGGASRIPGAACYTPLSDLSVLHSSPLPLLILVRDAVLQTRAPFAGLSALRVCVSGVCPDVYRCGRS